MENKEKSSLWEIIFYMFSSLGFFTLGVCAFITVFQDNLNIKYTLHFLVLTFLIIAAIVFVLMGICMFIYMVQEIRERKEK